MLILLGCAPPALVEPAADSTPTTPLDSGWSVPDCPWAGSWNAEPLCDGALLAPYIAGAGTAEVTWSLPACVVTLHLVGVEWVGGSAGGDPYSYPCHAVEVLGLEPDGEGWAASSARVEQVDPPGCLAEPAVEGVPLGPVEVTEDFGGLALAFSSAPWLLAGCAGVSSLALTPSP
jgi:hypothetical protein